MLSVQFSGEFIQQFASPGGEDKVHTPAGQLARELGTDA
jgi:hypothetical protein